MEAKQIPFLLSDIQTEEFATIENAFHDEGDIEISTSFNFGVSIEEHAIAVSFNVGFECDQKAFIILKVVLEFDIEPNSFKALSKNKKAKIPKDFLTHLAVLTVGTARGILHARLMDSKFDNFILPTLNVSEIVKEDLELSE